MVSPALPLLLALACAQAADKSEKPEKLAADAVAKINAHRQAAGLKPVKLDERLSRGCQAHARYLARNLDPLSGRAVNPHQEDPKLPGYTKEGDAAARRSGIHFSYGQPDPLGAVKNLIAGLLHRAAFMRPDLKRIGYGTVRFKGDRRWVVIDVLSGRENSAAAFRTPVRYPAPGQKEVPRTFSENEAPNPIPPEGRGRKPGFPVTVMFPDGVRVTGASGVLKGPGGKEVPVWFSSPEKPAAGPQFQGNQIGLIPRDRLRPGARYTVTVTAKVDGKDWSRTWSFTTEGR